MVGNRMFKVYDYSVESYIWAFFSDEVGFHGLKYENLKILPDGLNDSVFINP